MKQTTFRDYFVRAAVLLLAVMLTTATAGAQSAFSGGDEKHLA